MTSIVDVQDLAPRAQYTAGGAQTVFPYPFPIFEDDNLVVYDNSTLQVLTTDYTVSGAGDDTGGDVTFTSGRTAGHIITIYRDIPIERTSDFQTNGPFRSSSMNDELDRITLVLQQLEANVERSVHISPFDSNLAADMVLPSARAGMYLAFDVDGNPTVSAGTGNDTALRTDLASAATGTDGARLVGFRRTESGSVARTIADKLREVISPEDFGAVGDNVAEDTLALAAVFLIGGRIRGTPGKTYKITAALYCTVNDTDADFTGCTINQTTAGTPFLYIGRTSAAATFVKTDRFKLRGGKITGSVSGAGAAAYGITVIGTAADPYVNGNGCDDIEISGISISGFTGGFIASGASNVKIHDATFATMVYHAGLSAGGYGVLTQTCFEVDISRNYFKAGTTSRHAIYISADPSRAKTNNNVCKGVVVQGNRIDWTGTSGATGFEGAIQLRSPERLVLTGNEIIGGYGGISLECENGDCYNPIISNNSIRSVVAREAISSLRTSGAFRIRDAVVCNNSIFIDGAAIDGIVIEKADGVTCSGNAISGGAAGDCILFTDCTDIAVGLNTIRMTGAGASSGVSFSGTVDGVVLGRNRFTGAFTKAIRYYSNPTNLLLDYERRAQIAWAAGVATITDGDDVIVSAASDANGFTVTFEAWVTDISLVNVDLQVANSSVGNVYHRAVAGQVLTVGVADFAGAALPAAANNYTVSVSLRA